jgi:hypothetical protein
MSNESRFVSESLEALLVSIADGVREAQNSLSSTPAVDVFGRPMTTYHMPHLDFKLEVNMETVANTGSKGGLRLKIQKGASSESTREISSTLSGRLVAIPPNEGLPTLILTMSSERKTARTHNITISATNSAGEILMGQAIELNINKEASMRLSEAENVNLSTLRPATKLNDVILVTDETGTAQTLLTIDSKVPAKALLVLTAELGNESVSLSVTAGAAS